jgi:hypothetical protein
LGHVDPKEILKGTTPVQETGTCLAMDISGCRYAGWLELGLFLMAAARFGNSRLRE